MPSPSLIKGVKWRQRASSEITQLTIDHQLSKPDGTPKVDVMRALEAKANSVVFRVDKPMRFEDPKETNRDKAMDDIVDAILKAKNNNIKLDCYLWARIWLERDGKPEQGTVDATLDEVKRRFTPVLTKAKQAGVLDRIKGIALNEINCDTIQNVKFYANQIVQKFNEEAAWSGPDGPFFKSRSFLMPGAGWGFDFRGVGNDSSFLRAMAQKCAHFAFVYKFMDPVHETVTNPDYSNVEINGFVRSFRPDMVGKFRTGEDDPSFTVEDRKAFLNHFGLKQLTDYIKTYKDKYPTACNIVFWGDFHDGISRIPPLTRRALHSSLVKGDGDSVVSTNTGYFFTMAVYRDAAPTAGAETDTEIEKEEVARKIHLLDENLAYNQFKGWSGLTVSEEWERWPTANPGY